MNSKRYQLLSSCSGQSLVETALLLPFVLMLALNAINFGYFFFVAVNLAAAPRSGVEYSIQGFETPAAISLPAAGPTSTSNSISWLSLNDMTGALASGGSAGLQVCSQSVGLSGTGSSQISRCSQFNSSPAYVPNADPEAPNFVLNRVDVTYTFSPLIPGKPFNLIVLAACTNNNSSCTFHRQASMRAMN